MPLDLSLFSRIGELPDSPMMSLDIKTMNGGMVDKLHPTSLMRDQAVLLENILLKMGALAQKRSGKDNVMTAFIGPTGAVNGMGFFFPNELSATKKLVASINGTFYDWSGSGDWRNLTGGGLTGTTPVFFVQGQVLEPTFDSRGWFFQKGAGSVYEYNGSGSVSVVSGAQNGFEGSTPTGSCAIYWLGRLWVAEDGPRNGYISYSEFGKPTTFDISKGFLVNPNDEVTRIVQWLNAGIVIFQRNKIWALDIDQGNFEEFLMDSTRMEMLNDEVGCVAPKSVAQSGQDFFFLSRFGVMRLSKTLRDRAVGQAIPLSDKIENLINRINWNHVNVATAVTWENLYLLAVPVDGSSVNNMVLVWDIQEEAWSVITGWDVGDWSIAHVAENKDTLYFGTNNPAANGKVYVAFDEGQDFDESEEIVGVISTPRYDMGTTDQKKIIRYIDVFTESSSGGTVEVYAAPDNQNFAFVDSFDVSFESLTLPFYLPPIGEAILGQALLQKNRIYLDQFEAVREIQFQFRLRGSGQTKLLYFTVNGQPNEISWS
jgi:hypothetical protein